MIGSFSKTCIARPLPYVTVVIVSMYANQLAVHTGTYDKPIL
jgi:hypothetical protein